MPPSKPLTVRVDAELLERIAWVAARLAEHEIVGRLGKLTTQQTLMWLIQTGLETAEDRLGREQDVSDLRAERE